MFTCDYCQEVGECDCHHCYLGNPCIGCEDYDQEKDACKSNGGCGEGN